MLIFNPAIFQDDTMVPRDVLGFLIFALPTTEVSTVPLLVRHTPEHSPSTALDVLGHSTGTQRLQRCPRQQGLWQPRSHGWRQMHPPSQTPAPREEYVELLSDSQKGSLEVCQVYRRRREYLLQWSQQMDRENRTPEIQEPRSPPQKKKQNQKKPQKQQNTKKNPKPKPPHFL